MRLIVAAASLMALPAPLRAREVRSPRLDAVKARGQLACGVDTGIPGYTFQDSAGNWKGLDVAPCRAIADAVLGDPNKVKFVGVTLQVRFTVLKSGEIDVLIRDSEHTSVHNTQLGLAEPVVNFYTGQGFVVRKSPLMYRQKNDWMVRLSALRPAALVGYEGERYGNRLRTRMFHFRRSTSHRE